MAKRTKKGSFGWDPGQAPDTDPSFYQTGQSYVPDYPESERAKGLGNEGWRLGGMRIVLEAIPGVTQNGLLATPYRFQMPPTDQFTRQLAHAHNDIDTLAGGQHSRPIGQQLEIITFPTLVMEWDHPGAVWPDSSIQSSLSQADRDTIWNLLNVTATLERVIDSGTPVLLKAGQPAYWAGGGPSARGGWDVHMPATLRNLTIEERTGEIDARYLDVEFHEWRKMDVQVLGRKDKGKKKGNKGRGKGKGRKLPTSVKVSKHSPGQAVDLGNGNRKIAEPTLHSLAKLYYGDPDKWRVIRRANAVLNRNNWTASRPLGDLAAQHIYTDREFKIKIPLDSPTVTYADERQR